MRFEPTSLLSAFHAATTELLECMLYGLFSALYPAQKLHVSNFLLGYEDILFLFFISLFQSLILQVSVDEWLE